ncbi:MAG: DUF1588 domain-containing protein [Myxococcota bacterium]|nr:DUF1588 domain-containing protein [Myxococcota bacterium]
MQPFPTYRKQLNALLVVLGLLLIGCQPEDGARLTTDGSLDAFALDQTGKDTSVFDSGAGNSFDGSTDTDIESDAEPDSFSVDAAPDALPTMDYALVDDPLYLSNESVFACDESRIRTTPSRLWRLTGAQFKQVVTRVVGINFNRLDTSNPFDGLHSGRQFSQLAADFGMDGPTFDLLRQNARAISDSLTESPTRLSDCIFDEVRQGTSDCYRAVLSQLALELWRRPMDDDEFDRYLAVAQANTESLSSFEIIQMLIEAMAMSPNSYFRVEVGGQAQDADGRHHLSHYEMANALSFGILDGPPDDLLMDAAANGALETVDQIRSQVRRLLNRRDERKALPRFFQEFFGHGEAVNVFKDPTQYPNLNIASLVRSADHTIDYLIRRGGDSISRLLTSSVFVPDLPLSCESCIDTDELGAPGTPTRQDPNIRAGLLTHPAWLIAHSRNDETDPVGRGKFIREALLCYPVPDVPIEVDQNLPEPEPGATMRERLDAHSAPECEGCHRLMDPLGLAFETFNHVGLLQVGPNSPIDTRSVLEGSGDVDGPIDGALDLTRRLAESRQVRLCLTRTAFRFFMGRIEQLGDGCTLTEIQEYTDDRGGDFSQLLTALFISDTFRYRRQPAVEGEQQ